MRILQRLWPDMTFEWPGALALVFVIALALVAYVFFQLQRSNYADRFSSPAMRPNVVLAGQGWRRHVPVLMYLLAALTLVVGLARPQTYERVPRDHAKVILALDASRSLRGDDVEPSRIHVAKTTAVRFIESLPTRWEVGLVTFSAKAKLVREPTIDRIGVTRAIRNIELGVGTAIGDAIAEALPSRRETVPLTVVLLTDGNDNVGLVDPIAAARRARKLNIRVYTIGLGVPGLGSIGDEAEPANFDLLKRIARTTEAKFFVAEDRESLAEVYRELRTTIVYAKAPREITAAFAGGAFVFLALGGFLSALWFNRIP
ncbi:MAG: VWA domain-containing protein [Actinobacteria bacterium]|nr:VWA domain-containing protein [Actinomycetota bacterium]